MRQEINDLDLDMVSGGSVNLSEKKNKFRPLSWYKRGSRKAEEETAEEAEPDIPVITLEVKEQKRRAHHQKYQLGERNAILELNSEDAENDSEDAENI